MPIRARDVRANIKEMGFEKGIAHTLELALEEQAQTRQHLRELIELVNGCIRQMEVYNRIGQGMRDKIEQIIRDKDKGNELDGDHAE